MGQWGTPEIRTFTLGDTEVKVAAVPHFETEPFEQIPHGASPDSWHITNIDGLPDGYDIPSTVTAIQEALFP